MRCKGAHLQVDVVREGRLILPAVLVHAARRRPRGVADRLLRHKARDVRVEATRQAVAPRVRRQLRQLARGAVQERIGALESEGNS